MLQGDRQAAVSGGAVGQTFANEKYVKTIRGQKVNVFDTAGLNESSQGTVAATQATLNLYRLLRQLESGVNLLVYVMRAPRITDTAEKNYKLFNEKFCNRQVPIVIIITGLEKDLDMDQWWKDNEKFFLQNNMEFSGSACITADRGKPKGNTWVYQDEYEESKVKVEELIAEHCNNNPWKMESPIKWFTKILIGFNKLFGYKVSVTNRMLYDALTQYAGLSKQDATVETNRFEAEMLNEPRLSEQEAKI
jgi:hypothetical protein